MVTVNFTIGRVGKKGDAPVMMWVMNLDGKRKVAQLPIRVEPNKFKNDKEVRTICPITSMSIQWRLYNK